ncbi:RNA polymerase sigma factor [Neptunicella sp. SCSIO 80796]|uniref:RNA polymerase sigma factor n=1 Tax=Neptunicella plasticusilytica TaxID=3117012 RepID=UPI003A4D5F30
MKHYSDDQLVAIAQSCADHAAFEELFRRNHEKLRKFLLNKVNGVAVDDVMQETYIKAYTHISRYQGKASFSTWLFSIAINEQRQLARKVSRFDKLTARLFRQQQTPSSEKNIDVLIDFIKLSNELNDKQYDVFILHAVYSYSHSEISTKLGMAVGSVKTYIAQAQKLLGAFKHD